MIGSVAMETPVRHLTFRTEFRGDLPFHIKTSYHDQSHALWHDHDFWEMALVVAGKARHHTREWERPIGPGDGFLIPRGIAHEYRVEGLLEVVNLMFTEAFLDEVFPGLPPGAPLVKYFREDRPRIHGFHLSGTEATAVAELAARAEREFRQRAPLYEGILRAQFTELCFRLDRAERALVQNHPHPPDLPAIPTGPVATVAAYIQDHFAGPLSLAELSALVGWSPAYLSRVFKAQTGESPVDYINRVRIRRACQAMDTSRLPLLEISMAVGYNSLSFFNRTFRRIHGMSPREYRERARDGAPPKSGEAPHP